MASQHRVTSRLEPPYGRLPDPLTGSRHREVGATRTMVTRALDEGCVTVAFQPVADARAQDRVAFHEVLIRLRSPSGGLMSPGQFLPAVAGTPLAAALDRVALSRALATLRADPEARLSVNICPATLDDPSWITALTMAATEAPDLGYRLIVEMTEDPGFLCHPGTSGFLQALRALGVTVALDDFGAGATGFQYFRDFRFDIVKIDGSYGEGLASNRDNQALVRAMVALAQHFEMMTVIEFIDSPADAACATDLGVDCLQGFLFGRPTALPTPPGGKLRGATG